LRGLREKDFVYVHVEAPDEAGHMGDLRLKIEAIEAFDEKVVGTILKGMADFERYKILVLPDHPTPVSVRTHTADPVPYVIYPDGKTPQTPFLIEGEIQNPVSSNGIEGFDEVSAKRGVYIEEGFRLIERFLGLSDSS
jgi:2,3-bisphosphoglycerate-independent phosphoglycerate mutase